jgi:type II secretory pathway predicted ATPase ExeA
MVTGEAGIGKSTLLQRVVTELSGNVTCVVESDPRVSFPEILALLSDRLGIEDSAADEQTSLLSCQRELRTRLRRCQIVALMFDNAHHLSEQTLRQIIKHFLGGSAEDPEGTLLQLVLAGRPELKIKLMKATMLPLRGRTPLFCELEPLDSQEIAAYIEHGLRSRSLPEDSFDSRAIKRIALYAKGNPRSIDAISDRAQNTPATGGVITAERIDQIAQELSLRETPLAQETRSFEDKAETTATSHSPQGLQFTLRDNKNDNYERGLKAVSQTFTNYPSDDEPLTFRDYRKNEEPFFAHQKPVRRGRAPMIIMLLLLGLAGAAAWIGIEQVEDSALRWSGMVSETIAGLQKPPTRGSESLPIPETTVLPETREPLAAPADIPALPVPGPSTDIPAVSSQPSLESLIESGGRENSPPPSSPFQREARPLPDREPPRQPEAPVTQRNPDLQLEVIQAIARRAIIGVDVSVINGVTYLDGRVATERQRRAAERAARSVPEVGLLYNRIVVD